MALRRVPRVGDRVSVHYLDARVAGAIERVSADLHDVRVLTEDGELLSFALSPATARFVEVGGSAGGRLSFED